MRQQDLEAKLGTDLPSVGASILLAVGIVLVNFGIEGLLDIWLGDSLLGDVWCMVMVSSPHASATYALTNYVHLCTVHNSSPNQNYNMNTEYTLIPRLVVT